MLVNGLLSHGEERKWLAMSGRITTLLCELSIGTATLLNAVSLAAGADSTSGSTWHRELSFALLSLVFTLFAFCSAAFGVHTMLRVLRATAARISECVTGRARVRPSKRADTPLGRAGAGDVAGVRSALAAAHTANGRRTRLIQVLRHNA
eukprot:jgi/Ulvmu1/10159/UM006_0113.1